MINIIENASLLAHNTFGMDVRAALLAEYDTPDELRQLLNDARVQGLMQREREAGRLPFWHIGSGSNLLFTADYPGVVLHCTRRGITLCDEAAEADTCLLRIAAGTLWDDVCAWCAHEELYGPENLSLIPGETGAAAVQNIGAYGVELKDLVEAVECWDVERDCACTLTAAEMQYGYRASLLKQPEAKARYVVTDVRLRVSRCPLFHLDYAGLREAVASGTTAQEVREAVIRIREGKLPDTKVLGNAGSFFKNPVVETSVYEALAALYPTMPHYTVDATHTKIPAGWLIEQCGWKGRSLGQAGVYEKQSLVLVNRGHARPDEIVTLSRTIIADVQARFGIAIEPEVNLI